MNIDQLKVVKIEGAPFLRDVASMGLSNVDINSKNEYYAKVKMLKTQKEEINNIQSEVISIKNDMCEIKELLGKLISKGSNV
jgi:hypothetical protein